MAVANAAAITLYPLHTAWLSQECCIVIPINFLPQSWHQSQIDICLKKNEPASKYISFFVCLFLF